MEIHGCIQILRGLRFIVCVLAFHSMIGFTPDSLYRIDDRFRSQMCSWGHVWTWDNKFDVVTARTGLGGQGQATENSGGGCMVSRDGAGDGSQSHLAGTLRTGRIQGRFKSIPVAIGSAAVQVLNWSIAPRISRLKFQSMTMRLRERNSRLFQAASGSVAKIPSYGEEQCVAWELASSGGVSRVGVDPGIDPGTAWWWG